MTVNLDRLEFEDRPDLPGFSGVRRARVAEPAGGRHLGASLWEVPPGQAAYPYHYHLREEELVIVLAGRPTLRGPDGLRELQEHEVVAFPAGEVGAHQILNRTEETIRFLTFSEMAYPEVCVYPDSGKVGVFRDLAGHGPEWLDASFRLDDRVDYWDGEPPPDQ